MAGQRGVHQLHEAEPPHLLPGDEDNSVGGGQFGASVALAGDGGTALVGGYGDAGVGAAWLFKPVGSNT